MVNARYNSELKSPVVLLLGIYLVSHRPGEPIEDLLSPIAATVPPPLVPVDDVVPTVVENVLNDVAIIVVENAIALAIAVAKDAAAAVAVDVAVAVVACSVDVIDVPVALEERHQL